jgi:uncharacterized protein (DUF58 family)
MSPLEKLPARILTARGWAFILTGVLVLFAAQVLGRRDLLYLAVFLAALPLVAALLLVWLKPRFTVTRRFRPPAIETGSTTTVRLALTPLGISPGRVTMREQLPARFGDAPAFHFPSSHPTRGGTSVYEYRLRSNQRGLYGIGPVTAEFTDPFGLGRHEHTLGQPEQLVVTPAPVELAPTTLTGARGLDGTSATRRQANPSDDDVTTREYRHGDPLRRVHWAATARAGALMVRQEESVTTPQATIIMDQRERSYTSAFHAVFGQENDDGGSALVSTPAFEWAVTAAVSAAAHLLERSYALRFLDEYAAPALRRSVSAPWPEDEEFHGLTGLQSLAEGLAALELAPDNGKHAPASAARPHHHRGRPAHEPFGDKMVDKLAAHKLRGPLIAILGELSREEAKTLAMAAEFGSHAFAMLVVENPHEARPVLDLLRSGGWRAVAVTHREPLAAAWALFDAPVSMSSSTAKTIL